MNIAVTWPKTKPLEFYRADCASAHRKWEVINYRVAKPPAKAGKDDLCYLVYDGEIVGYQVILCVAEQAEGVVQDPRGKLIWPAGWYIVRSPQLFSSRHNGTKMKSFRGFRYVEFID